LTENSKFVVQGGILDSLSGDLPPDSYRRRPQAGESTGQPAYAARIAWTDRIFGQPLTLGAGGYYGRQNYGLGYKEDGWAGTADWSLPLGPRVSLDGEFYRGRAIGGLGGGIGRSVLFGYSNAGYLYAIQPLNSAGGWSQLKLRAAPRLEFNAALGLDNPFAYDLRSVPGATAYVDPALARNQGWLANVIYRPRSDLLFSGEYHHLKTSLITSDHAFADQVGLMMGVLF
jgi:hypothetical protein